VPSTPALPASLSGVQIYSLTGIQYITGTTVSFPLPFSLTATSCRSLISGVTVVSCSFKKNIFSLSFSPKDLSSGIKYISLVGKQNTSKITKTLSFSLLWKGDLSSQ
jgi:hypothetical protein